MFTMCQRIEKGLEPLRTEFGEFVKNKGLDALSNISPQNHDPKVYVQTILDVFSVASRMNQDSFSGEFKESLDKAAAKFINK